MRLINFLMLFIICLALALFSLENTEAATIQLLPGVEVQAPLAIELILTMGIGSVLAWLYGAWNKLQHQIEFMRQRRQIRNKEEEINALKQDVQRFQAEINKQRQLPPASETLNETLTWAKEPISQS
jgi:lipopolysaccharide assembly protein A